MSLMTKCSLIISKKYYYNYLISWMQILLSVDIWRLGYISKKRPNPIENKGKKSWV